MHAAVPRLRQIAETSGDEKAAASASRVLSQIARDVDSVSRLDRNEPTTIVESRDARSDADLISDIHAALRDPVLRKVYEKAAP